MKIGIYTQPLRYNYGGLLQNWALQTVLQRMGHDVITLDPSPYLKLSWKQIPFVYTKRLLKKMMGRPSTLHYEEMMNLEHPIKIQHIQPFIDSRIKRKEYWEAKELKPYDFDILIAGSDQVWRPVFNRGYRRTLENSFFDFAEHWDVKRIAYAASFGTDKWEFSKKQTKRCSELAKLFNAISVREKSGVDLCREHLGVNAVHVLDPTLLLDRSDYDDLIEKGHQTHAPSGNLLCYILDETENKNILIDKIAADRGLVPFRANSNVENPHAPIEEKIQPSVEQWLRNFEESKFVVTDSFHACVFSIIFNIPFIVIGNKSRGMSRYESLLSTLSLEHHLIMSPTEYDSTLSYDIGLQANNCLQRHKDTSLAFLEKNIKS